MSNKVHILDWRPLRRQSLLGFVKAQFPSGLVVADNAVYATGSRVWVSPPSRPMLDRDGNTMRDQDGKVRFVPIISFYNHGVRAAWSRSIIAALREAHPEALPDAEEADA